MNSTEAWRHECEVAYVAAMSQEDLHSFMALVKKARPQAAYTKLRADVLAMRKAK